LSLEKTDECEVIDAEKTKDGFYRVSWDYPDWGKLYSFTFRTPEAVTKLQAKRKAEGTALVSHVAKCLYFPLAKSPHQTVMSKFTDKKLEEINKSREECVFEMARMTGCKELLNLYKKMEPRRIPVEPATKDERKAFWLSVTLLHPSEVFKDLAKLQLKELE
jgi:hypothetical protein